MSFFTIIYYFIYFFYNIFFLNNCFFFRLKNTDLQEKIFKYPESDLDKFLSKIQQNSVNKSTTSIFRSQIVFWKQKLNQQEKTKITDNFNFFLKNTIVGNARRREVASNVIESKLGVFNITRKMCKYSISNLQFYLENDVDVYENIDVCLKNVFKHIDLEEEDKYIIQNAFTPDLQHKLENLKRLAKKNFDYDIFDKGLQLSTHYSDYEYFGYTLFQQCSDLIRQNSQQMPVYFDNVDLRSNPSELYSGYLDAVCNKNKSCLSPIEEVNYMDVSLGINVSTYYIGSQLSLSPLHIENQSLASINMLHSGEPKLWLIILEHHFSRTIRLLRFLNDHDAFEENSLSDKFLDEFFATETTNAEFTENEFENRLNKTLEDYEITDETYSYMKNLLYSKTIFFTPNFLNKCKIHFSIFVQTPGTVVYISENTLHQVINMGPNFCEAVNFGSHRYNFANKIIKAGPLQATDFEYQIKCLPVKKFYCKKCQKKFLFYDEFVEHRKSQHVGTFIQCDICTSKKVSENLVLSEKFVKHIFLKHFMTKFTCFICLQNIKELKRHVVIHFENNKIPIVENISQVFKNKTFILQYINLFGKHLNIDHLEDEHLNVESRLKILGLYSCIFYNKIV